MQDWQSNMPVTWPSCIWLTFHSASQLPQDIRVFQCIRAHSFATCDGNDVAPLYQAPLHTLATLTPHLSPMAFPPHL